MAQIQINRANTDPPAALKPGELWLNLANARLWGGTNGGNALLIDPGGSGGPYLPLVGGTLTGPLVLPADPTAALQSATKQYVDAQAGHNIGRNYLHNALFNVQQRGAGGWTTNGQFGPDRWQFSNVTDTINFSIGALNDANRTNIGDESAIYGLLNTFTGNAGATAYNEAFQRIENVRRLSGKTVTVSFWAWCASGTSKLGVSVDQNFGTGGSPSAAVLGNGQAVTISTTETRYSLTFTIPSVAAKTLGTNGDHNTQLNFFYSSGANYATRAGNIGVQSGTVAIWGTQLEIGSQPTPLEKLDPRYDLANCIRFYQTSFYAIGGNNPAGPFSCTTLPLVGPMRASPAIGFPTPNYNNCSALSAGGATATTIAPGITISSPGLWLVNGNWTASADL